MQMQILVLLLLGAAAGFIANRAFQIGASSVVPMVLGAVGALFGGLFLRTITMIISGSALFIGAMLGAALLIWLWAAYGARR